MGSVYLAEHVRLKTHVAVKFLHIEMGDRDEAIRRFEQEARIAASLRHNHIIQIFDVGSSGDGEPFIVMEYLEGESLADLIKRIGPMDLGATCGVIEPTLSALAAAQRKGIIHRDLKPNNVFLARQPEGPPAVKIIDFGLSKITTTAQDQSRTRTGSVLGTPAYMSPEQARGASSLDHRTDLYSLGIMMFEMLTGGLPYSGSSANELFANLLTEEPRAPRDINPSFPMAADAFVRKAIHKNPDERFQSATEMLESLASLPGFADREERLARLSTGLSKSSFASGELGTDSWASADGSGRAADASQPWHEPTILGQPGGAPAVDPARHVRRRLVIGAMVAAALLIVAAGFAMQRWTSRGANPAIPQAAPTPPPTEATAGSAKPPSPTRAEPTETATVEEAPRPATTKLAAPPRPGIARPARIGKPGKASTRKRANPGGSQLLRGRHGIEISEQFE